MILHARDLPALRTLGASICVIGAGPVGITLALELARAGRDVLLLETGESGASDAAQDAYRGTVTDPALHGPLDLCRIRRLGGSSTVWAGRSAPFDLIDFESRPWIPDSGWPIDYATMTPSIVAPPAGASWASSPSRPPMRSTDRSADDRWVRRGGVLVDRPA